MLKNLAYLAAFTTFVVLVWISLSIYNSLTSSTLSKVESVQVIPIASHFNTQVIDSLKNRIQISVDLTEQISSESATQPPIPSSPQQTQSASQSSIISPTPIQNVGEEIIPDTPNL